jgi:antitoxin ParD1/3/4
MANLNISLPQGMKTFVEEQIKADEHYSSVSDYLRALIREDQKRRAAQRLETLLLEGLDSGEAADMTAEEWQTIRREVHRRIAKRKSK